MKKRLAIIFFLFSSFKTDESINLTGTKWKFRGFITPAMDTISFNNSIDYKIEFSDKKTILVKASFVNDTLYYKGKYRIKGNDVSTNVYLPKGIDFNMNKLLANEEFNLRLKYNQAINGKNRIILYGTSLILKRDGIHTMLYNRIW
jgi:hypothetical protein